MTVADLLAAASERLAAAGSDSPRADAEVLLAHTLERPRSHLRAWPDGVPDAPAVARYAALVERRAAGEPVAYLTGRRGFWTLDLTVTPATLIPRPETERLVELALERLPADRALRVADLGTGSGAIALALAAERPRAQVTATDASAAALAVARANAAALGLANLAFAAGDWCAALDGRYALIAANPPYLAADDPHFARGDLRFEPRSALAAGIDGLDALRRIVADAPVHLESDGWLLLEHGHDQGEAVPALLRAAGYREVECVPDLAGRPRVSLGRAPRTAADRGVTAPLPGLDDAQLARYARQVLLAEIGYEGQQRIAAGHALVLGLGGLGSPVALYLAAAGTGTLVLVDDDRVEASNLQRQIAHTSAAIGRTKVDSAAERCRALNPAVAIRAHALRPDADALAALVAAADVIVDCSDNYATRHALNAACRAARRPLVSGAAIRWAGQLAVFDARDPDGPCYRCLYPDLDDNGAETCVASGVVAPLVGVIGALQAAEALKLLAGLPSPLAGRLLRYDALAARVRTVRLRRDPDCPVCGPAADRHG